MMAFIFQLIGAYLVSIVCAIFLEAPKNLMFKMPIVVVGGWFVYLILLNGLGINIIVATYLASLVIAWLSHKMARRYHKPVTLFFLPGFFTLVPGGGMYRTALAFIQGETTSGFQELGTTMFTALAIALAVYTIDSAVNIKYNQQRPKFIRKNRMILLRKYTKNKSR